MTTRQWNLTSEKTPPEDIPLDTISPGGMQQPLVYYRGLFWDLKKDMYVYYIPERWAVQ